MLHLRQRHKDIGQPASSSAESMRCSCSRQRAASLSRACFVKGVQISAPPAVEYYIFLIFSNLLHHFQELRKNHLKTLSNCELLVTFFDKASLSKHSGVCFISSRSISLYHRLIPVLIEPGSWIRTGWEYLGFPMILKVFCFRQCQTDPRCHCITPEFN